MDSCPGGPWLSRGSLAVPGVPAHQGAASGTSVLHHLHLLMGLMEDAWAQAHHGPGVAGACLEETVLHEQTCDHDPGGT